MKYPEEHWETIAKQYTTLLAEVKDEELTGAKTPETVAVHRLQDRYPHVTHATMQTWVNKARAKGYL